MKDIVTLRVDLGIQAQQIASQLILNNKNIEETVTAGIQKAIDTITEENNFDEMIAVETKKALQNVVHQTIHSWAIKQSIR